MTESERRMWGYDGDGIVDGELGQIRNGSARLLWALLWADAVEELAAVKGDDPTWIGAARDAEALAVYAEAGEPVFGPDIGPEVIVCETVRRLRPCPGGNWFDVAPPTPPAAFDAVDRLASKLAFATRRSIAELWAADREAAEAAGTDPDPHRWGECFVYEALGHGVAWSDDHPARAYLVPHVMISLGIGDDGRLWIGDVEVSRPA